MILIIPMVSYRYTNNWWGTLEANEIESMIRGRVDYEPWLIGEPIL